MLDEQMADTEGYKRHLAETKSVLQMLTADYNLET